jgi:peptidyl-prolyl cis-trans isomerase C
MNPASQHHFLNYLILRTALNNHQKSPLDLSAGALEQVQHQAQYQFELETKILASPDASSVIVPAQQLNDSLAEIQARYNDEDEFVSDLAKNNLNIDGFQAALYRELQVNATLESVAARAEPVSALDVQHYYQTHEEKFNIPETRTARHILITINDDYEENHREAARERILHLWERLKRHPEQFSELAQRHSECATALQGGLLGRVPRGQLYAELDHVLFMMQAAQISQLVESELGFHLLYCEKIHFPAHIPLEDAYAKILELLQQRRRLSYQKNWLALLA